MNSILIKYLQIVIKVINNKKLIKKIFQKDNI